MCLRFFKLSMIKSILNLFNLSDPLTFKLTFDKNLDEAVDALKKNVKTSISSDLFGESLVGSVSQEHVSIKKSAPWLYSINPTISGSFSKEKGITVLSLSSNFSSYKSAKLGAWFLLSITLFLFIIFQVTTGVIEVTYLYLGIIFMLPSLFFIFIEKWFFKKDLEWLVREINQSIKGT